MHQKLTELGWKKYYDCKTCPQNPKSYYSHKDHKGFDIVVRTRSQTFSIVLNNRTVSGPHWGYQMADKLKNYTWA